MKQMLLIIAILLLPQAAHAKPIRGMELASWLGDCMDGKLRLTPEVLAKSNACQFAYGYITGVVDQGIGNQAIKACIPDDVDFSQVGAVIDGWLTAHPERHPERAGLLIRDILQETWPCPE